MPKSQKGFSIVLVLIIIVILIVGGYLIFRLMASGQPAQQGTAETNCTTGIEGNTGDNFCSNYHETSSKCRSSMENIYPDGCTKP